jgi:hypothetical protein
MANNTAMTPEDKVELARLDVEQVKDDAEVIHIAVERTQYAQQGCRLARAQGTNGLKACLTVSNG